MMRKEIINQKNKIKIKLNNEFHPPRKWTYLCHLMAFVCPLLLELSSQLEPVDWEIRKIIGNKMNNWGKKTDSKFESNCFFHINLSIC